MYKLDSIRECLELINKEDADLQGFLNSCVSSLKEILNSVNFSNDLKYSFLHNVDSSITEDKSTSLNESQTQILKYDFDTNIGNTLITDNTIQSASFLPNENHLIE